MTKLNQYLADGASCQSRAVMAYLQTPSGIEESWSDEFKRYMAEPSIARWENCREQGYVVSMRSENHKQINIAFFEHRNSDSICAVMWGQNSTNSPTIETAVFGNTYKDKYDVSHDVRYGEALEMSDWIFEQLTAFWIANKQEPTT